MRPSSAGRAVNTLVQTTAYIRYGGARAWSLSDAAGIKQFFARRFGRALPIGAFGQSALHNRWGYDHRNAMDVGVNPGSNEGQALMEYLRANGIPFTCLSLCSARQGYRSAHTYRAAFAQDCTYIGSGECRQHITSVRKEVLWMDGGISNGVAAIMGALVGGLASLASTWVSERTRHRRDLLQREITKRETTYSDFIDHASKLYVTSATHNLNDDDANLESELEGPVSLYGIASRIRLFASDRVIKEAEAVLDQILIQFGAENISVEQLREKKLNERDPLKAFSVSCRRELQDLQRVI